MNTDIIWIFTLIPLIALSFGIILSLASKFLAVKKDERIEKIESVLPGINCGACGYAGCSGYAEAVVNDGASLTLCSPGGADVSSAMGSLMGQEVSASTVKMVAFVACQGNHQTAEYKFDYKGLDDCRARSLLYQGDKACPYGCLGGGSCISVCPVDAIKKDGQGLVKVNPDKCIGCGKCIDVCPTGVIRMIPSTADSVVACNSMDKGGIVKKYCTVGCIGCKICDRKSPEGGFIIENFLATIDYNKEGSREEAKVACPMKCIIDPR